MMQIESLSSRALVVIDFELVFDVWSLLCCCVRAAPRTQPFLTNEVYPTLFHKQLSQTVGDFDKETVIRSFRALASSVKPWVPAYQLLQRLQEHDCDIVLRHSIEEEYIKMMPIVSEL